MLDVILMVVWFNMLNDKVELLIKILSVKSKKDVVDENILLASQAVRNIIKKPIGSTM